MLTVVGQDTVARCFMHGETASEVLFEQGPGLMI